MTDYAAATESREALMTIAEQLEDLTGLVERVDALNATAARLADALEQLVRQHHAASRAAHGPTYETLFGEGNQ